MTEQEAIARLQDAARPAWYISRASVRAQDLRILLESYERMRKALEEQLGTRDDGAGEEG